ncbi:MAG: hypothetical protein LBT03_00105 [Holosporales bacterium]|nr:hypothetical protein [Holosporales bacterium]
MLRIANRMFWTFLLCMKFIDIACLVLFTVIARVFTVAKMPLSAVICEDSYLLTVMLLQSVLIFVCAEKFMNLVRRPFKHFNLKPAGLTTRTKGIDRITLYLAYFSVIFSGSLIASENFNYPSIEYVLLSYLVVLPLLCLTCILLTKFFILRNHTISLDLK